MPVMEPKGLPLRFRLRSFPPSQPGVVAWVGVSLSELRLATDREVVIERVGLMLGLGLSWMTEFDDASTSELLTLLVKSGAGPPMTSVAVSVRAYCMELVCSGGEYRPPSSWPRAAAEALVVSMRYDSPCACSSNSLSRIVVRMVSSKPVNPCRRASAADCTHISNIDPSQ